MKKVKIILFNILILTMVFCLSSCLFSLFDKQKDTNNGNHKDDSSVTQTIPREFWGRWTRMDNGAEYYFDSSKIYVNGYELNRDISLFSLESDNVMKYGSYRLFRKEGQNRSFSFELVGFEDTVNNARISLGFQDITGRRENQNNKSDSETIKPTPDGKLEFTDAVPGDDQKITITTPDNKVDQDIVVTPSFDDEVMGTLPLLEDDMYGFKITYSIDSDEQGLCYGNSYKIYNLNIYVNNIGKEICATSTYDVTCSDPRFVFMSGEQHGNFSSIKPNTKKALSFSVRYTQVDQEYIDVPIDICIQDSKYKKKWNDKVYVRFYKGLVPLKINSINFNKDSDAELNGFIIYPDGRSKRFAVSNGYTKTVNIPWSSKDYILAFSGATAETEMGYSFGFPEKTALASLEGQWSIDEINAHDSNDTVNKAENVSDLSKPIKAYLQVNDLDFFKLNNSELKITKAQELVSIQKIFKTDLIKNSKHNNQDYTVNPGELINLDICIKNPNRNISQKGLKSKLTTSSEYVTFTSGHDEFNYGDLSRGNYSSSISKNCDYESDVQYSDKGPFEFTISKDTPIGTIIPFTLITTNLYGESIENEFNITVSKRDLNIQIEKYTYNDDSNFSAKNNNDGIANPGESLKMEFVIYNRGKYVQGVNAKLSTDSPYISFLPNKDEFLYGDLSSSCYSSSITKNVHYNELNYTNDGPFQFDISPSTPFNTKIPFTFTITDSLGTQWSTTFNLTVQPRTMAIIFENYSVDDDVAFSEKNNGDDNINPGETIKMDFALYNRSVNLQDVKASLDSSSPYVSFISGKDKFSYGDFELCKYSSSITKNVSYNDLKYAKDGPFQFVVSPSAPFDTVLPFTLTLTDSLGSTHQLKFELKVEKRNGNITFEGYNYFDFETYSENNNGDDYLNPGETVTMDIVIGNNSNCLLQGLTSTLSSSSSFVTFDPNMTSCTYGDLNGYKYSTSISKNLSYSELKYSQKGPFVYYGLESHPNPL